MGNSLFRFEREYHRQRDGIIAAFFLPAEAARQLALSDEKALPPEELHITLAYYGRIDEVEFDRDQAVAGFTDFVNSHQPLAVELVGHGRFEGSDDGEDAFYITVGAEGLDDFRDDLVEALSPSGLVPKRTTDYIPHITLTYLSPEEESPNIRLDGERTITFDTVYLVMGEERVQMKLGSTPIETREKIMADNIIFMRAFSDVDEKARQKLLADPSLPVPIIASTEGMKRDGKNLLTREWSLERYSKYPIVLYGHDFRGQVALPLATSENVRVDGKALKADIRYDLDDEFAQKCRSKTIKGMLAYSVTWDRVNGSNNLVEISNVNLGVDPDALPELEAARGMGIFEELDYSQLKRQITKEIMQALSAEEPEDDPAPETEPVEEPEAEEGGTREEEESEDPMPVIMRALAEHMKEFDFQAVVAEWLAPAEEIVDSQRQVEEEDTPADEDVVDEDEPENDAEFDLLADLNRSLVDRLPA